MKIQGKLEGVIKEIRIDGLVERLWSEESPKGAKLGIFCLSFGYENETY